jgi:hypothetical protein
MGLVLVIAMCSCMGIMAVVTNSALASVGGGSGTGILNLDTGTGKLSAAAAFPTYTVPASAPGAVPPVSPIPNSQTPQPSPTDLPTPTDVATSTLCIQGCGGGGGGGGGGTVHGSASPNPWIPGQIGYINAHTSAPNIGIAIIVQYANGATQTYEPAGQTDGNGDFTFNMNGVPVPNIPGQAKITIFANFTPEAAVDVFQQVK